MADKNTIVTLNIGSQRVGMARFKNSKGKLVLTDYESTEILADPAAASSRNAQIKMAVLELAQKLKVKNRVSYAVSGQSVFMRFVLLPGLDGVSIDELVAAEAQQNIPFSLDEVKWDWQEITEVDGEKEVVIAAVKSVDLNEIQDAIEGAGMFTTEVDPSPMALYNAFKVGYPDIDEPCMLLDIGAKTSNVIYIDGERVFSRSIAIGGATVTTAIAKEYNVPFLEAENQKKSNGMVALDTRHTSKLDELTAALATCIRTALNRMPAEIARTTNFYRSQQSGSAPKRVFIAGGGANLPKITSFLQERLRLPVEFFNPLRGVVVNKSMDLDKLAQESHLMGELVGLAARRADKAPVKLQLVPDSVQKEKDLDKRKTKLLIGSGTIVLGLIVYWAAAVFNNYALEAQVSTLESKLGEIQPEADKMRTLVQGEQAYVESVEDLIELQEGRTHWILLLNELKRFYGSGVFWFTELTPLVDYNPEDGFENTTPLIGKDTKRAGNPLVSETKGEMVNAIYLSGIWVDTGKEEADQTIKAATKEMLGKEYPETELQTLNPVSLERLEKGMPSRYFSRILKYRPSRGNPGSAVGSEKYENFGADKIFMIKGDHDSGKLGSSFQMIIPLKNPVILGKKAGNLN